MLKVILLIYTYNMKMPTPLAKSDEAQLQHRPHGGQAGEQYGWL